MFLLPLPLRFRDKTLILPMPPLFNDSQKIQKPFFITPKRDPKSGSEPHCTKHYLGLAPIPRPIHNTPLRTFTLLQTVLGKPSTGR
jgi:hypothetical protein